MFSFFKKTPSVSVKEIDEMTNKHRVIDIRTKREIMRYGKIKGIRNIEMEELLKHPENHLQKDKEYFLMCQSGVRSKKTVKELNELGYNTVSLKGGYYYYSRF